MELLIVPQHHKWVQQFLQQDVRCGRNSISPSPTLSFQSLPGRSDLSSFFALRGQPADVDSQRAVRLPSQQARTKSPRTLPHSGMLAMHARLYRPYIRVGEASHPGPIVAMPGDGHCLYHALAWWAQSTANIMRHTLATTDDHSWSII